MAVYTLPDVCKDMPLRFELQMLGAIEVAPSVFTGAIQRSEYPGDLWVARLTWNNIPNDRLPGIRSFFNHMRGGVHLLRLWHLQQPVPLGTVTGAVTLGASAVAGANQITITKTGTLLPGDFINVTFPDTTRQLLEIYSDDGTNLHTITPPLRKAASNGAAVTISKPYADFMLTAAPFFAHEPLVSQGFSVELVEYPS